MMAPDYTHWHGMFEVAERFYIELIAQAEATAEQVGEIPNRAVIDGILARPEHAWFREGAEADALRIRREMEQRYSGPSARPEIAPDGPR